MSNGFEFVTSQARSTGPQSLPQLDDRSAVAAATVRLGQAVGGIGSQIQEAQKAAQKARATTGYLTEEADLSKRYENDPDPATSAKRYADEELKLRQKWIGEVSDPAERAHIETSLTRYGVVNQSQASSQALRRQADGFNANLDATATDTVNRASRAGSPTERAGVTQGYFDTVDDGARRGWITQQAAQARKSAIARTLDDTDAVKLIDQNPQAALFALQDPQRFGSLTPELRQSRIQQAQAKADALGAAEVTQVAKADPARAIAMVGRVTDRSQIGMVILRALIPQESSGDATATSPKGAAGLTQFMPDTARATARREGLADLDGLNDEGVREVLRTRPDLALRLGQRHLSDLAQRYEGRLAPAFAAYHAGAGNADKWHAAAVERFGAGYTPAQFASVVPDSVSDGAKKTKDYVTDMFRRLGADPATAPRFSPAGTYAAASSLTSELRSQATEQRQIITRLASVAGDDADGIVASYKQGYAQDPNLVSQTRATLTQAAALGDATATRKLRELDFMERVAPGIREAYATPPQQLEAAIASESARLAQAPHVSPAERERLQTMRGVSETIARERNTNPVGLLERSGAAPVAVPGELFSPAMAGALAQRSQQAADAAERFGAELKPLKPQEAAGLKAGFERANPDEKFRFAAQAAGAMSEPAYRALMDQIGADKLTVVAGKLATYDQALGQKVARGAALMKQAGVDDGKAADLKTALGATLGGSVYPPGVQADLVDAALAVYVADRDGKGALFDPSDARALGGAIESVTGQLAKVNRVKVPVPRGVPPARFEHAVENLSLADLGGTANGRDGKPVDIGFIRSQARLRPQGFGDGRYLLALPGPRGEEAFLTGADGQVLVVDMMPLLKRSDSAWPQSDAGRREQVGRTRAGLQTQPVPDWAARGFIDLGGGR